MWNPMEAGEVFVTLGDMLAKGGRSRTAWKSRVWAWSIRISRSGNIIVDQLVEPE